MSISPEEPSAAAEAPAPTTFTGSLEWRRAAKAFASEGPAPDLAPILRAAHMAPTCFGIQPYRVVVVSDPAKLAALQPLCYNQAQVGQASAVLVFVALKDNVAAGKRLIEARQLATHAPDYAGMIEGMMQGIASVPGGSEAWSAKQAYIALGFALAAAAEHRISSCPMEGFDPAGLAPIVGAKENEFVAVIMAVGRTHPDEAANSGGFPQWRFPMDEVVSKEENPAA